MFVVGCGYGMFAERTQRFPFRLTREALSVVRSGRHTPAPAAGRWKRSRQHSDGAELTEEQREELTRLESIGYLTGSMNGNVVHEWQLDFRAAWPGREISSDANGDDYWRRIMLLDDGGIVAIYEGLGIIRLDRDSKLVWARAGGYHHDVERTPDGGFAVLDREARVVPRISRGHPVLEDFVTYLDADGNVLRRISLLEAFEKSPYASLLTRMNPAGDIFHTNTLEILDGRLSGKSPAFRSGNLLISVLRLDTIAIVDPNKETVVWALTGMWRQQHQPTVLLNGRMLLFDNKAGPEISEVVEFDPFSQTVAWSYRGAPGRPFYSETCGSNQRLENGNTLITESDNGRAFEVTSEGTVVWEYINPYHAGPDGEYIATLFEIVRLPSERPDWME